MIINYQIVFVVFDKRYKGAMNKSMNGPQQTACMSKGYTNN